MLNCLSLPYFWRTKKNCSELNVEHEKHIGLARGWKMHGYGKIGINFTRDTYEKSVFLNSPLTFSNSVSFLCAHCTVGVNLLQQKKWENLVKISSISVKISKLSNQTGIDPTTIYLWKM